MPNFEQSYLGQLRKIVGHRKLITPGVIGVIQDREKRILLVQRRDNNVWEMPGGSMELDQSVVDCIKQEVKEETGLNVALATPISLYSGPRFSFTNRYDDELQPLIIVFRIDEWGGSLLSETDETVDARFFSLDEIPDIPKMFREIIEDLKNFDGQLILK